MERIQKCFERAEAERCTFVFIGRIHIVGDVVNVLGLRGNDYLSHKKPLTTAFHVPSSRFLLPVSSFCSIL
jgi:hypothetical protein